MALIFTQVGSNGKYTVKINNSNWDYMTIYQYFDKKQPAMRINKLTQLLF